jgi:predicted amidohydrolase YtcJ
MGLLIQRADLAGDRALVDVHVDGDRINAVAPTVAPTVGDEVIDAEGNAVVPGLADHHVHLLAWAAALDSVRCGPPQVSDRGALARALQAAPGAPGDWIRGVGYHESVAGVLDRIAIDELEPHRPVRIQHRSGMLWMLNSAAVYRLRLDEGTDLDGVERDNVGRVTGRCWDADARLRERIPRRPLDLGRVGTGLAAHGVTAVTDATATTDAESLRILEAAAADGRLPQRVTVMGPPDLEVAPSSPLRLGPVKIVLRETDLPDIHNVVELIAAARAASRSVAFHCTTRVELVFALAALDQAGAARGDRIEHGGVVPPELHARLGARDLTVVTQPNFVAERGDQYLREVDAPDLPHLYPCASLRRAGIRVAAGTDAPFGDPDPWRAMHAATERRTVGGAALGADERVDGSTALGLFLGAPDDPGGRSRRVAPGVSADLCVLSRPLRETHAAPHDVRVAFAMIGGAVVYAA